MIWQMLQQNKQILTELWVLIIRNFCYQIALNGSSEGKWFGFKECFWTPPVTGSDPETTWQQFSLDQLTERRLQCVQRIRCKQTCPLQWCEQHRLNLVHLQSVRVQKHFPVVVVPKRDIEFLSYPSCIYCVFYYLRKLEFLNLHAGFL